jgi:hypothetical protein
MCNRYRVSGIQNFKTISVMKKRIQRFRYRGDLSFPAKACLLLFMFMIPSLFFTSCDDQRLQTVTWTEYEPVYMAYEEFLEAARLEEARDLEEPGKIFLYNNYLFVNEVNKGIHIIDNQDPSSPQFIGFINIPANKDMAVRGDRLYADSANDLLVFDISDFNNPELLSRKADVFQMTHSQVRGFPYRDIDASKGVVIDWEPVEVTEVCRGDCNRMGGGIWGGGLRGGFIGFNTGAMATDSGGGSGSAGQGGSMARFALTGDYLYVVDWSTLVTFGISDDEPVMHDKQNVGWLIETIFPYNENLFIGSANSMYIYDISNPSTPNLLSRFRHATACDPVVVEGDYAYVTLRDGEICPNVQGTNHLEVINVKDLENPKRVGIYEMIHPHGLGIDNGDLFVSEGDYGLKIMDASDPYNVKEIRHIKDIRTIDVIPSNGVLIVTGADGIIQYDYSDIDNFQELSMIPAYKQLP